MAIDIKKLEYIVMEGGGARGAAYLGAIQALEEDMKKLHMQYPSIVKVYSVAEREPGLLDYYRIVDGEEVPIVKGIAGSSAGAITTFALALGFNSKEIEKILKYPFKNFLKEVDAGRYRMVDENGNLAVGQDKRRKKVHGQGRGKELAFEKEFKFDFHEDSTEIGSVGSKLIKRDLLFGTFFKIVIDGAIANVKQVTNLFGEKVLNIDNPDDVPGFWRGLFRWAAIPNNKFWTKAIFARAFRILFFWVLIPKIFKTPMKFDARSLTAMLSDRGMFSGFAVREFFMDMLLFAATRDTQFHRGIRREIQGKNGPQLKIAFGEAITLDVPSINTSGISNKLLGYGFDDNLSGAKAFEIGNRKQSKIGENYNLSLTLKIISQLTFSQFNKFSNINFGACVSNFSTGLPIYFGHEWTPDFRIMEAVSASMSIPPAIRPLYNADNVVKDGNEVQGIPFIDGNGDFELADYYLYEHAVKLALQQEISKDSKTAEVFVHVNNAIDVSTFMPKLRSKVNGEYSVAGSKITMLKPDKSTKTVITINKREIIVDYALYKFFYNATYKGLLLDGGYRNNIPYNFFRLREGDIKKVLAIKLDEHFPPDLMEAVFRKIRAKLNDELIEQIVADLEQEEIDIVAAESGGLPNSIEAARTVKYKITMADVIAETALVFTGHIRALELETETEAERKAIREIYKQLDRHDRKAIKRLVKATLKNYQKKQLSPPWTQRVNIITTAFEGYSYGSERGQVKQISDHNQILPLYDYGVGTYDFDMSKVMPLINLAQTMGKRATLEFLHN